MQLSACIGAMAALNHGPDWPVGELSIPPMLLPNFAFSIVTSITVTSILSMAAAKAGYRP